MKMLVRPQLFPLLLLLVPAFFPELTTAHEEAQRKEGAEERVMEKRNGNRHWRDGEKKSFNMAHFGARGFGKRSGNEPSEGLASEYYDHFDYGNPNKRAFNVASMGARGFGRKRGFNVASMGARGFGKRGLNVASMGARGFGKRGLNLASMGARGFGKRHGPNSHESAHHGYEPEY